MGSLEQGLVEAVVEACARQMNAAVALGKPRARWSGAFLSASKAQDEGVDQGNDVHFALAHDHSKGLGLLLKPVIPTRLAKVCICKTSWDERATEL